MCAERKEAKLAEQHCWAITKRRADKFRGLWSMDFSWTSLHIPVHVSSWSYAASIPTWLRTYRTVKGKGKAIPITGPVWPRGWVEV